MEKGYTALMIETVSQALIDIADDALHPYLHSRDGLELLGKEGEEALTSLDLQIEGELYRFIKGLFPSSHIVGEEGASAAEAEGRGLGADDIWLIDPLDGTRNFLNGTDEFAVMLCRLRQGVQSFPRKRDTPAKAGTAGEQVFLLNNRLKTLLSLAEIGGIMYYSARFLCNRCAININNFWKEKK